MTILSLGQAAKLTGLGKTTLARAIKAGRLSATRREDGGYLIDASELARCYPFPAPGSDSETSDTPDTPGVVHQATPPSSQEVTIRLAELEVELRGMRELVAELRQSRDGLQETVTRLTAALPAPAPQRRRWWRRAG